MKKVVVMQVKYKVSFADYEKAALAVNNNIPTYDKAKFSYSLILGLFFFLILPFGSFILNFILTLVLFLVIYYVLFDLGINFILKIALRQKSKETKFPKDVTLNVNEKEFTYTSITEEYEEEFTIPWVKITTAVETDEMYVLYASIFSTFFILKKDYEANESSKTFNQTIKDVFNEHYIST